MTKIVRPRPRPVKQQQECLLLSKNNGAKKRQKGDDQ